MADITIGYQNHCLESGVTFTPTSEGANNDADNLGKPHPESYWRLTTISGKPNVLVTFPGPRRYRLVAPLYTTASPHQNLVRNGHTLSTTAGWTSAQATRSMQGSAIPTLAVPIVTLSAAEAGAGSVQHAVTQAWTRPENATWTLTLSGYVNTASVGNTAKARFELWTSASHYAYVDIDLADGSVNSSSALGDYAIDSATSTLFSGTWYRVVLTVTMTTHEGGVTTRLWVLNSSYATTYTGAGESYQIGGVTLEMASSAGAAILGETGKAPFFSLTVGTNSSDLIPLVANRNLGAWYATHGWTHGYKLLSADQWAASLTPHFYDPHNTDSQLDISQIYIGPVWQPTQNIKSLSIRPARTREWTIDLGFQSRADAWAEAHAMGIKDRLTDSLSVGRSYSGAEYVAELNPVLVIIDPDEDTYGQEQILYGRLTDFQMHASRVLLDTVDNVMRPMPAVSFSLRELLPG